MDDAIWVYADAMGVLSGGGTLSAARSYALLNAMLGGELGDDRIRSVLAALAEHDETSAELAGGARAMREHVSPVVFDRESGSVLIDTCGTGGAPKTFNVSTCAAIVLAGVEGVRVAKHGNRSRTGRGSAEVLSALGVNIEADAEAQGRCLREAGVCFCYAVRHHPSVKHAMNARRALDHPTIFNALGPMTNPVGADAQLIGVYKEALVEPMARALMALGATRGMVVHSEDGLDEVTLTAATNGVRIVGDRLEDVRIDPREHGMELVAIGDLRAGDVEESARIVRSVVEGEGSAHAEMVVLTCAAALWGAGASGSIGEGIGMARGSIGSGAARGALEALVRESNR
jgi:anthranilate phosphoribosyltransferase